MIFQKTILLILAYGFLFSSNAQNKNAENLADTAFQPTSINSKKSIFFPVIKIKSDSIPHKKINNTDLFKVAENKFSNNFFKTYTGKPLADLQQKIKIESDKYFKQPVLIKKAQLEYAGLSDRSYWLGDNPYYQGRFLMSSDWMVAGIPVSFNLNNQLFTDEINYSANNFDFRFDKDAYLEQVKNKLGNKLDPSSLLNNIEDPLKLVKEKAEQSLTRELSDLGRQYDGLLDQDIDAATKNSASFFSSDIKELRQRFLSPGVLQKASQDEARLSAMQQKTNAGEKVNSEEMNRYRASLTRLKGLQEMLLKIQAHKTKWDSSGMMKKIGQFELLKKSKLQQAINDPGFIRKQARQHLSLKGLQKLFLNVNRLNIGRDALSVSPMSFQHFLHTGISTEFLTNKGKTMLLAIGKQKDNNSVLDQRFTENLVSNNSQVKAARIGLLSAGASTSHIAVSSFNQSMGDYMGLSTANEFRRVLVTTISNQLRLGEKGSIEIDLSRSATSYQQNNIAGDSVIKPANNLNRILSPERIMANSALSLRYADENTEKGLSYQFNFSKVANGYNNPGSSFLNGGSVEFGTQLRKSFLKKRMQFSFRGNLRDYKYNDEGNAGWRNVYMVIDGKWRMKKGQHISVRYQPNRMTRAENGKRNTVTYMDRLSVESNLYKKFGKTGYRNYLVLAWQKNVYALSALENVSNSSLQLNSFQNISLRRNLLYANLSYTHSSNSSQWVYFNSSLNSDIGYSFQLFKKISASSGIVYGSVNKWYRQLGIRQALNGQLNEKFYISIYVDARKNLQVLQPLWSSPVRADISIKYILKK